MTESQKDTIIKIAKKSALLLVVLAVLDVVYYFTLYPKDLEEKTTMMEISMRAKKGVDMVYLGESSNHAYSEDDTDQRSICTRIDEMMPNHTVGNLTKNACHAGVYYDILRNIPKGSDVKTAIVTVNMRSFTSEWIYSNLETPLRKEQVLLKRGPALYKRLLLAFKAYPRLTEEERAAKVKKGFKHQTFTLPEPFPYHNANEWDLGVGGSYTLYNGVQPSADSLALACHHIKHFACELDDKNPRIKDLDRIVRLCHKRGWQPVFNILAEDVDQIDSLCGPELLYLLEKNVQYVTDRYENMGVITVNNLKSVRDDCFFEKVFPTEHYNQVGRQTIAQNVVDTLNKRLP